jgi:hypothetical protein
MATPNVPIQTLDPRDDAPPAPTRLAQRPATLDGKFVGLFSNNKPHSLDLLRRIAAIIGERYDIAGTVEHNKGGWQWPARIEDLQRTASSIDVAIHATAE